MQAWLSRHRPCSCKWLGPGQLPVRRGCTCPSDPSRGNDAPDQALGQRALGPVHAGAPAPALLHTPHEKAPVLGDSCFGARPQDTAAHSLDPAPGWPAHAQAGPVVTGKTEGVKRGPAGQGQPRQVSLPPEPRQPRRCPQVSSPGHRQVRLDHRSKEKTRDEAPLPASTMSFPSLTMPREKGAAHCSHGLKHTLKGTLGHQECGFLSSPHSTGDEPRGT